MKKYFFIFAFSFFGLSLFSAPIRGLSSICMGLNSLLPVVKLGRKQSMLRRFDLLIKKRFLLKPPHFSEFFFLSLKKRELSSQPSETNNISNRPTQSTSKRTINGIANKSGQLVLQSSFFFWFSNLPLFGSAANQSEKGGKFKTILMI